MRLKLEPFLNTYISRAQIECAIYEYQLGQLRTKDPSKEWAKWETNAGIYVFYEDGQDDCPVYVGRSISSTKRQGLGSRIYHWLFEEPANNNNPEKSLFFNDNNNRLIVVSFQNPEDWYWVSSLENYLIQELKPRFNVKK